MLSGVICPFDASRQSNVTVSPDWMRNTGAMLRRSEAACGRRIGGRIPVVPSQMALRAFHGVNGHGGRSSVQLQPNKVSNDKRKSSGSAIRCDKILVPTTGESRPVHASPIVFPHDIRQVPHCGAPMRAIPRLVHRSHVPDNLGEKDSQFTVPHGPVRLQPTPVIWLLLSGIPIITLFRHARIANIARALEQRTIWPAGWSRIRWMSSSRSFAGHERVSARAVERINGTPFISKTVSLLIG